jgi:diketogulonate reductase-like aldo/keto reductase
MYARAEGVVGDLATELGVAHQLFQATKVWTRGRGEGIRQMEQSFDRMRVQTMDLMQIHNLVDWRTHLATLREWKARGRIRYIGITHYVVDAFDELEQIIGSEDLDFVQLNFSIATRAAERRMLPYAAERGVAVIVNRPYESGALFRQARGHELPDWAAEFDCASWGQFFLKYILSEPHVSCVIPATSDPRHLVDNMRAGYGRLPDTAMRQRMVQHLEEL